MSSRRTGAKYELIAECKPEWSTSYIFIHKTYQFNVYLAEKNKKSKRIKKPRTHTSNSHPAESTTNSVDSETFHIHVLCIDNDSKPLDMTEHSISPSSSIHLSIHDWHSFTVTIRTLSMNHGDSQFRLSFHCDSPDVDCNIANQRFISVRVIHYKFKLYSTPRQLQTDDYKFYKDVKPKTNFLEYDICLLNANGQRAKPPRTVPIKCVIYFENGAVSPNQKALNLKGINTIYNEPYQLNEDGVVTVPLRIEETSTKYENRKFQIKFIADYEKITSNLDIAPIFSEPFLVRTKINKYRIKNKEPKKKPGRKKKIKTNLKEIKDERSETVLHESSNREDHEHKSVRLKPQTPPQTTPGAVGALPQVMPLSLPSFIMPPLFATAPGMNMIQIDGKESVHPPLTLPLLIESVATHKQETKRGRKRNAEQANMNDIRPSGSHKRHKITKRHRTRRPTTRSMTKPKHAARECDADNVEKSYGFNEETSDKILEPIVIETLRMLGEAIGRREYFVSGSECICYLKCLFCGSTAYPPKEKRVEHVKGCLLSILYHNITQCVSPRVLLQAFDLNPPDFPAIDLNNNNNNNNNYNRNHNTHHNINLLNMPTNNDIPPIPKIPPNILPQLPNMSELNAPLIPEIDIAPYTSKSRRNSSGSFGLVRSDRCKSFNGFIAPFNTLLDITPTPTQQNTAEEDPHHHHLLSQSLEDPNHVFGTRSRSNSYKLVPVSFPNTNSNHTQNALSQQSDAASFNSNLSANHGYGPFPGTSDLLNSSLYRSGSAGAHSLSGLLRGLPLNLFNGSNILDNDLLHANTKNTDHDTHHNDNTSKESSSSSAPSSINFTIKTQKT